MTGSIKSVLLHVTAWCKRYLDAADCGAHAFRRLEIGQARFRLSTWTIVGLGGGHHDFHPGSPPYGSVVTIPYWGSRIELMEVIAMAREGRIHAETTEFPLDQVVDVYGTLKARQIKGRAVLVPSHA